MPCLLTNSWKPGVSVSEVHPVPTTVECAIAAGIKRGNLSPSTFFNV